MESIATLSCSPPVASGRAVPRLRSIIRPLILLLTSLRESTNSCTVYIQEVGMLACNWRWHIVGRKEHLAVVRRARRTGSFKNQFPHKVAMGEVRRATLPKSSMAREFYARAQP